MICTFCCSRRTHEVLDFGDEALAGGFLKRADFAAERFYPLRLFFCEDCAGVQLADRVDPQVLFGDYFYHTSATATAREHFKRYADEMISRFAPRTVLEIGCNDGVMLKHFAGRVPHVWGVDPASVARGISMEGVEVVNDFFGAHLGMRGMDLIVANNVFAHVDDIHGLTAAVAGALSEHGVFVFEVHSLAAMVEHLQYDWIYHEHLYYYSLLSLERLLRRHGLRVFDVARQDTHGGSVRYFACKDQRHVSHRVGDQRGAERLRGLDRPDTFSNFAWAVQDHAKSLRQAIGRLRTGGRVVGGYGASGRAAALIQHADLGDLLHCMFDDAPAKAGFAMPGSHLHINPGKVLFESEVPESVVLFAWTYLDEIAERWTGRYFGNVIVPFPEVAVRRFAAMHGQAVVI